MPEALSSAEVELNTIRRLVDLYTKPESDRIASDTLLVLADIFRLLEKRGSAGMVGEKLLHFSLELNTLASGVRSLLAALIGPAIGGLVPQVLRELASKMEIHRNRIQLIDTMTNPRELYDALLQTGWITHLTRDEWSESDHERMMTRSAENFFLGKLEYDQTQLQELFDIFVTRGEEL